MKTRAAMLKDNDENSMISGSDNKKPNNNEKLGHKSQISVGKDSMQLRNHHTEDHPSQPNPKSSNNTCTERRRICVRKPSRNPYINFVQVYIQELRKQSVQITGKALLLRCSEKWRTYTAAQKQPFIKMAKKVPCRRKYSRKTQKPKKRHSFRRRYTRSYSSSTYSDKTESDSGVNSTRSSYRAKTSYSNNSETSY